MTMGEISFYDRRASTGNGSYGGWLIRLRSGKDKDVSGVARMLDWFNERESPEY